MTMEQNVLKSNKQELITFSIGTQDFCMDIMLVREIRGWTKVTILPHAPADVMGVMNLRGAVVPIVDLSARLGLGSSQSNDRDVIIIALIDQQTIGFVVTSVSDIVGISQDAIQPMPRISGLEDNNFVKGIITSEEKTLRVLDISALAASMTVEHETA